MKRQLPKWILWTLLSLSILAAAGFLFLDTWLLQSIRGLHFLNNNMIVISSTYFRYIGTDVIFSYLYIILVAIVLYQWHVHRHIAYKPLFIALSLSVTLAVIYCLATFFLKYIPHITIIANNTQLELLNDPRKAFPSGHVARLVTLITCIYILYPKKSLLLALITLTTLLLIGISLLLNSRYFISSIAIGSMIGIIIPHYVKNLIFVQRIFHSRSGLEKINMYVMR